MTDLSEITARLVADTGLSRTPHEVLITRWAALLAGESPIFEDASIDRPRDARGSYYTFLAVTETSVCFLHATHQDDYWEHSPRGRMSPNPQEISPGTLVAWRRPLSRVSEISLGGDDWSWLADQRVTDKAVVQPPTYTLTFDNGETVELPLGSHTRAHGKQPPLAQPVVEMLAKRWRASP